MFLLAIIGLVAIAGKVDSKKVELCDGQNDVIRCKPNEKIRIIYALYGRKNSQTCAKGDSKDYKRCDQMVPRSAIKERCDGKTYCPLSVSLKVLGLERSCGANNYLTVDYVCIPPPTTAPPTTAPKKRQEITVCSGHTQRIFCVHDEIIQVTSVYWGRENMDTCPDDDAWWWTERNCKSRYAKKTIEVSCNGRTSCELWAFARYLGNPCWGVSEYLKVGYQCKKKPAPTTPLSTPSTMPPPKAHQQIICANGNTIIKCPGRRLLSIEKATYGRQDKSVCPQRESKGEKNCSVDVTKHLEKECEKKDYCIVAANLFVKMCPGSSNYVAVSYKCL